MVLKYIIGYMHAYYYIVYDKKKYDRCKMQDTQVPLLKLPSEPDSQLLEQAEQAAADLAKNGKVDAKENDTADILEVHMYYGMV